MSFNLTFLHNAIAALEAVAQPAIAHITALAVPTAEAEVQKLIEAELGPFVDRIIGLANGLQTAVATAKGDPSPPAPIPVPAPPASA